jgi:hypothetical protein
MAVAPALGEITRTALTSVFAISEVDLRNMGASGQSWAAARV